LFFGDLPHDQASGTTRPFSIPPALSISIRLAREGGVLRLVCGPGRVRDALTVTRLVEAIPTFETEVAALANFS
jgi:hypothetical protein